MFILKNSFLSSGNVSKQKNHKVLFVYQAFDPVLFLLRGGGQSFKQICKDKEGKVKDIVISLLEEKTELGITPLEKQSLLLLGRFAH